MRDKRKWWLLIFTALVAGLVCLLSLSPREYGFVAKYDGVETGIPIRNGTARVDPKPYGATYYGFKVDPLLIAEAVDIEAKKLGWTKSLLDHKSLHPYADWSKRQIRGEKRETMTFVPAESGDSFTCYVAVTHRRSWLDRQWTAVKKWFGR